MRAARLAPFLVAAVIAAGCGTGTPSSGATTDQASSGGSAGAASPASPSGSSSAVPQSQAAPTDEATTATPKPSKTPKPSASAAGSGSPGAAGCSGTGQNQAFFADAAAAVDWTVVCAVLPNRWFVSTGSYRQAKGGRLMIQYKGPGGATLSLSEGAWCADADGCVPAGDDLGDAALGPLAGTLIGIDGGGFAVAVDQGESISWLLETQGLDQATSVKFAAAAVEVGD